MPSPDRMKIRYVEESHVEKKIGATNEIKEVIMMALSPKKLLLNPSNG